MALPGTFSKQIRSTTISD
ncbi:hypothetical protein Zm00014a_005031 [Zea mays]|uniref:Uncharacterized protein n=1 Tax=Zea mays TaxID=4577 RepID=A0A3L6E4C4_MAIZE|nr:hypothetical protein Zm00014a_005032 [Zea mays]PWZ14967.1 hypothetical protein Zm00014a_005031 [Zea mays]